MAPVRGTRSRAIGAAAKRRGTYCPPMPTAIARSTPNVTSGDTSNQLAGIDQAAEVLERVLERLAPEEDPGEAHEVERDELLHPPTPPGVGWLGEPHPLTTRSVASARARGRRRGWLPRRRTSTRRRARARRGRNVSMRLTVRPATAAAVAAERDVEVVAQPPRQRHVPAPPEVLERPSRCTGCRSSGGKRKPSSRASPIAMSV